MPQESSIEGRSGRLPRIVARARVVATHPAVLPTAFTNLDITNTETPVSPIELWGFPKNR